MIRLRGPPANAVAWSYGVGVRGSRDFITQVGRRANRRFPGLAVYRALQFVHGDRDPAPPPAGRRSGRVMKGIKLRRSSAFSLASGCTTRRKRTTAETTRGRDLRFPVAGTTLHEPGRRRWMAWMIRKGVLRLARSLPAHFYASQVLEWHQ